MEDCQAKTGVEMKLFRCNHGAEEDPGLVCLWDSRKFTLSAVTPLKNYELCLWMV